jgi:predicted O-methyltransferase YrrM
MNDRELCDRLMPLVSSVRGHLSKMQGIILYELARKIKSPGAIVELGAFCGLSTVFLGLAAKETNEKVISIDTFESTGMAESLSTFEEYLCNLIKADVIENVLPLRGKFHDVVKHWLSPIKLLFIDGSHDYDSVKEDFLAWSPFVVEGGCIMIHDFNSTFPGVVQLIREIADYAKPEYRNFIPTYQADTSIVFERIRTS